MGLFQLGQFRLSSGRESWWKFEADELGSGDWETLAHMALRVVGGGVSRITGVPRGGLPFAEALREVYGWRLGNGEPLVVDDVLTTGASIQRMMREQDARRGLVVLARGPLPPGVEALFVADRRLW